MKKFALFFIFLSLVFSFNFSYGTDIPENYKELLKMLENMPEGAEIPDQYKPYMELLKDLPESQNPLISSEIEEDPIVEKTVPPLEKLEPTEKEMNLSLIKSMERLIENSSKYDKLNSILILKDGKIYYEKYFNGTNADSTSPVYSVSKSITSLLVGIAEDKGLISTEDCVLKYFDKEKLKNIDKRKENIKIKHLLTMESGLKWGEEKNMDVFIDLYTRSMIPFSNTNIPYEMMSLPMAYEPGSRYDYNSMHGNIIDEIIFQASGLHLKEFADENLFGPLGIENYSFERAGDGSYFGGKGLSLSAIDMAKIGALLANDGIFNDTQILSKEYLEKSTKKIVSRQNNNILNYGYSWNFDEESIRAAGSGGQRIDIYKEKGLVIVYKTNTDIYGKSTDTMEFDLSKLTTNYILKAIK